MEVLIGVAIAVLGTVGSLIVTALWRALVAIGGLPAAVTALEKAVDRLVTVPPRLDRLEAAVFPEGVPTS